MPNNKGIIFRFSSKVDKEAYNAKVAALDAADASALKTEEFNTAMAAYKTAAATTQEIGAAVSAETTARETAVSGEASAREAADTALDGRVTAVESGKVDKTAYNEKMTQLDAGVAAAMTTADFNTTIANYKTSADTTAEIGTAVAAETTARETAVSGLQDAIDDINEQLGGSGEGGASLTSRVADLEAATVVGTSKDLPILEDGQINDDYMPTLKFQGQEVGKLAKEIDIIGIGDVSVNPVTGHIQIRLGENRNSSCFNNNDGTTNGAASRSFTATGSRTLADGTSKTIWMKGTNTVTITTADEIHFDDNTTGEFKLTVNDQEFVFGPITGAGTYGEDTTKAKLVIGNDWGIEANAATGAKGYSGKITVTVNIGNIIATDGYVSMSLIQTKGAVAPKAYNLSNLFYLVTDTTTVGSASDPVATLSDLKAKQLSGVTYLTSGTVNYSANIANVGTPATAAASTSPVLFNANNFAADATVNVAYNATTASGSGALTNGEYLKANNTVAVTAENINGKAAAVSASVPYDLLVENTATTASTTLIEYFNNEVFRLNADGSKWDSAASLVDVAGLQVKAGSLIYPTSKNYAGLNEGLSVSLYDGDSGASAAATIAEGSQPNYTGLTGARTYIRQFSKEGSMPGGTIVLKTAASVQTAIANGSLVVEVCKAFTGASTDKWYNIGYGAAANEIGKSNSSFGTTNNLVYVFSDGNATDNIWVRITMSSAAATINEMSLA